MKSRKQQETIASRMIDGIAQRGGLKVIDSTHSALFGHEVRVSGLPACLGCSVWVTNVDPESRTACFTVPYSDHQLSVTITPAIREVLFE